MQAPPLGEVPLTAEDFAAIVAMVQAESGIVLSASKRDLVYGRLRRRLRTLRLDSFAAYRTILDGPDGDAGDGPALRHEGLVYVGRFRLVKREERERGGKRRRRGKTGGESG